MQGYLLHTGAEMNCPHSAPVTIPPSQTRVLVGGQFVATASDLLAVTGCPFQVPTPAGPVPQPCIPVRWERFSSRVMVNGEFVLLETLPSGSGDGMCLSETQIPAGPPIVTQMQQRVVGE